MDLLYLNRVAQQLVEDPKALAAFKILNVEQRSQIIGSLGMMTLQSHPTSSEVNNAIESAGLRATYTPCQMLLRGELGRQIARLPTLPDEEMDKSFQLLINLFRIADQRRRDKCGGDCSHWWHQDLSGDEILQ